MFLALAAGMAAGVATGLVPGLHPNAVIFMLLPLYFRYDPATLAFVAFATGMSIVNTFTSFIPSVFVGAPEGDTALSVLPGHRFLRDGRGVEAVELSIHGGLVASLVAVAALPVMLVIVPPVYAAVRGVLPLLLAATLLVLVLRSEERADAAAAMLLAGTLGTLVLDAGAANSQYVLFPLFAGLFGVPTLLLAARGEGVPRQGRSRPVTVPRAAKGGTLGVAAGAIAGFLPGLGTSQAALLVDTATDLRREDFIALLGGITTADLFLSLAALYLIGNPRSGAAVAIRTVADRVTAETVARVLGMAMVSVGVGAVATRVLARRARRIVAARSQARIALGVTALVTAGTWFLTGWFGLLVLGTATALGTWTALAGVPRSHCMAALIVPTIASLL